MSTRSQGAKYDASLPLKEIAKRVRADIATAVAAGELPAGLKVGARIKTRGYYQARGALTVYIKSLPLAGPLYVDGPDGYPRYSDEAIKVRRAVESLANAYNYDRSDVMTDYFDVNYYSDVVFDVESLRAAPSAQGVL